MPSIGKVVWYVRKVCNTLKRVCQLLGCAKYWEGGYVKYCGVCAKYCRGCVKYWGGVSSIQWKACKFNLILFFKNYVTLKVGLLEFACIHRLACSGIFRLAATSLSSKQMYFWKFPRICSLFASLGGIGVLQLHSIYAFASVIVANSSAFC